MKKIYLLLMLLASTFTLAACSRDKSILRVGMDLKYPPFETIDGKTPKGMSVDIAQALGAHLNRKVEIVNTDFASLITSLRSGEVDVIISSMSITEERKQIIDFSNPYMYFQIISLVNKEFADANNITAESTKEQLMAVPGVKFAGLASQVSSTIPESYGMNVTQKTSLALAIESVSSGDADVLLMSANPVADGRNANKNTTMIVWSSFVSSPIGVAIKKGNPELLTSINAFVANMSLPGGVYDQLRIKYDEQVKDHLGGRGFDFYITE